MMRNIDTHSKTHKLHVTIKNRNSTAEPVMAFICNGVELPNIPFEADELKKLITLDKRGQIILAHLILENLLEYFITNVVRFQPILKDMRLSFSQKLTLAKNLGLRNEFVVFCKKLNAIRNKYSHQLSYKISANEIYDLKELQNKCFSSPKTDVQDNTLCSYTMTKIVGSKNISETLTTQYSKADSRVKIATILYMFICNKLLVYLQSTNKILEFLDNTSSDRINDFINLEKQIEVTPKKSSP